MSLTRRSLQVFAFICTLVVGVASMAVIVTQTTWFKEWLRGFIVRQADDYVNGRLTIGRLDGNLFFGVEMEDVDITMNGNPEVGLNDLSGIIRRHEDSVTVENLSLRTEETSLRVGGSIRSIDSGNPVINLKASSDKFSMKEAAKLVPALRGYDNLQPAFEINASGPADRLDVQLNAREKVVGEVSGNLIVDARGPERRIAGNAQTDHFDVGALVRGATIKTDVTGRVKMDLVLAAARTPMRGTYVMNASRAVVAGYEARNLKAKGRIDW